MNSHKCIFLIAYDYGMGGVWGLIRAHSKAEVRSKYPQLSVYDAEQYPSWASAETIAAWQSNIYNVDEPPRGLIALAIAEGQVGRSS